VRLLNLDYLHYLSLCLCVKNIFALSPSFKKLVDILNNRFAGGEVIAGSSFDLRDYIVI
jgi:hypothetical protein